MKIRKAEIKDIKAIDEIYNQAILLKVTCDTAPLALQNRMDWFRQHEADKHPVFVAEVNQIVAGWLSFSPYRAGRNALKHTAEISYYIHRDYQRKGIGSELLGFAIQTAPKYNFKILFAILLENNAGSIRLLEKFKFSRWGLLPGVAEFDGEPVGHLYYGMNL